MKEEYLYGDCLELMKGIPKESIDMILCDLPYGTTACKWDSIIPFDKLWEQYNRIIKPNGAIVLTAAQPFTTALGASNLKDLKYEWIWEKPQGTNPMNAKMMPLKSHENILVFYKKKPTYNPQMWFSTPYQGFDSKVKKIGEIYGDVNSKHRDNPDGSRYPKTILKFPQEKGLHPTQKPVALFEYLIKTYTNEGDLVLDNCAGSGTTAIAAMRCERQFIIMEKEEKYYEIIKQRINDEKSKCKKPII